MIGRERPTLGLVASALALLALSNAAADTPIRLRDDVDRSVHATRPASRIVTLAPFLTEYVVSAGAADLLVGIAEGSDQPPVMRRLPRIADVPAFIVQHQQALRPDLVLAFMDDIRPDEVDKISSNGAVVFVARGKSLADVPALLRAVGTLVGRDTSVPADRFSSQLETLAAAYAKRRALRVFVELSNRPLATAGKSHFVNDALRICGADNVFQDAAHSIASVSWEDVAGRNPAAIVGLGSASSNAEFRANWALRSNIPAVSQGRIQFVEWGPASNPTPQSPGHIAKLCEAIDMLRREILDGPALSRERAAGRREP